MPVDKEIVVLITLSLDKKITYERYEITQTYPLNIPKFITLWVYTRSVMELGVKFLFYFFPDEAKRR